MDVEVEVFFFNYYNIKNENKKMSKLKNILKFFHNKLCNSYGKVI